MNTLKYIITPLLLLAFAAGCKVSKDIATPSPELPVHFRNDSVQRDNSVADISWRRYFSDPPLEELIDRAIAKNYDMQLAVKTLEAAQWQLKQTKWLYLPDARVQAVAGSNRPSDNSLNGLSAKQFLQTVHVEDYTASVTLNWEADIWGKIRNQRAGALAAYLQTEEAKKAIHTNIVAAVSQGYFNLLMLQTQIDIARKNIRLNDSTLRIIRLQYNAGQVSVLAVQQAEAQQLSAAALVPELEKNKVIQENALSILAGDLPAAIKATQGLPPVPASNTFSAGVPAEMVRRRPDIRVQELALTRANAAVGITKANMYPTLGITAGGGLNAFKLSNWFNVPAALFGTVAGSLVQPLFQKQQLRIAYEIARVEREKTVIQFRQAVLDAVGEVSDALVKIEKFDAAQGIVATRVTTLQQAIGSANLLFSSGMANYLEVITAQGNVLQSELELAAVRREQLNARVELYRTLGGGWK